MIKTPAMSKYANDFYALSGEIPGDKIHRPLSEGGCDFVKSK
jgi:branched-chain amino acid transport system substrate-binding protein